MRKKNLLLVVVMLIGLCFLTACDPEYPPSNIEVEEIEALAQGTSVSIEIIYPNTGGSIVQGWKEQSVEIIDGEDIVSVSDLTITGLKPGTAKIKVNATTVISEEAAQSGLEERVYSTEMKVIVE